MRVLVVNAGSSSLKVHVVDGGTVVSESSGLPEHPPDVDAVGHRIVHGGQDFAAPVVMDERVESRLAEIADLAPLHQPKSLAAYELARRLLPDLPHVACFDTAFHASLPPAAYTYPLPREWRERWPVRRYGFHGLAHAWTSRRARELAPECERVVTAHLGAGASLAAVAGGRSVDTTMGFTPLEGLMMATRSGSVDPGLVTWLEEHEGLRPREVADALEHRSGLLGLAGTGDMREVLAAAGSDDAARLALDVYVHRLAAAVAAMTASLGGLDALVFSGGVGEHAAPVRAAVGERLGYLGVALDAGRNSSCRPDAEIGAPDARVRAFVLHADEAREIARSVEAALG